MKDYTGPNTLLSAFRIIRQAIKSASPSAGDGLSKEGDTLSVITPTRGSLTQEEFYALPEAEQNNGLYFIRNEDDIAVRFAEWSPQMTANNAPAPFACSASSTLDQPNSSGVFSAFDGDRDTFWHSKQETTGSWIKFDFGAPTEIGGIVLYSRSGFPLQLPKTGTVQGSNDGAIYIDIFSIQDGTEDRKLCEFSETVSYRFYRIYGMLSNYSPGGGGYTSIGEICFLRPVEYQKSTLEAVVVDGKVAEIKGGVTMEQVNQAIQTTLETYSPMEIYSTEETRIGTWIDGKPLYRVVRPISLKNSTLNQQFDIGLTDVDTVTALRVPVKRSVLGNGWVVGNYSSGSTYLTCGIRLDHLLWVSTTFTDVSGQPAYAIVEYTKTTDQAVEEA